MALTTIWADMNKNSFSTFFGWLRRWVFGLSDEAVNFDRRGFRGADAAMRRRIDCVCRAFLTGYHFSLEGNSTNELESKLAGVEPDLRGFAFEGAAMGLALRERVTPWNSGLIKNFLAGCGQDHTYMIHVGLGWVWAHVPLGFRRRQKKLDPLLGWLAFDGWGFYEGFFHWPKYVAGQPAPKKLKAYERRAFDQGLGRSFWFVNGGNVELIARTIADFAEERRADLWSGIGLAASYAGIVNEDVLKNVRERAGQFHPSLAQGAAFAAKARLRAGNLTNYTELAVKIFCEMSAADATHLTDAALENLPTNTAEPAYEIWRRRIQAHFVRTPHTQVVP